MAKIRYKCACGKILVVGAEHAGKVTKCPACQRPFRIPEPDNAPRPKDIPTGNVADQMADLARTAVRAQTQGKRIRQALDEIEHRQRRRRLKIAAAAVGLLLAAGVAYPLLRSYGPTVEGIRAYPIEVQPYLEAFPAADERRRAAAAWEAADALGAPIAEPLAATKEYDGRMVKIVALRALGRMGKAVDSENIAPFLQDEGEDLDVRMTAAFVLARREAETPLRSALRPLVVRVLAQHAGWRGRYEGVLDGEVRPDFRAWFRGAPPESRRVGAWVAAALGGWDVLDEVLVARLHYAEDAVVRISALHAAHTHLGAGEFARLHATGDTRGLTARYALIEQCGRSLRQPDPRVRSRIPPEENVHVRRAAALAIADNGQDRTAAILARGLQDDDWFVRFACAKGLARLNPGPAALAIGNPPEPDEHPWVQRIIDRIRERAREATPEPE
jgi:hypothetical protein